MLSPDYLKGCADDIVAFYQTLEDEIINDIVRRLVNTDFEITQSAVWQAEKLQQAGMMYDEVIKRVSKVSGKAENLIRDLFEAGGAESLAFDDAIYRKVGLNPLPIRQSKSMLNTLLAGAKKTGGAVKNLTMTTATTTQAAFIQACDFAYLKISSGAFDADTAIRQAIKSIAETGTSILYPSGHTDKIDVAVRRAVTTGVSQTCGRLQWDRADEMGCDLVETTAHMGARLEHSYWQGKVFSRSGTSKAYPDFVESTGYGSGDGLMGWNCRHGYFPFFEDISVRAYTDKELKYYQSHTVTYNGKKYTDYDASQKQRKRERDIRATKRELNAYETAIQAGQTSCWQDYEDAAVKLKRQESKLADFLSQTGREEDKSRVLVNGFGRSEAKKATNEAVRYYHMWRKSIGADDTPETLAKYYDMKYNNKAEYARLLKYIHCYETGQLSPLLSYAEYKRVAVQIESDLVGITTVTGITIEDYAAHFVCRVIGMTGSVKVDDRKRKGVATSDIRDALTKGVIGKTQIDKDGKPSILFKSEKCGVSVNPDTKNLVQVNPL